MFIFGHTPMRDPQESQTSSTNTENGDIVFQIIPIKLMKYRSCWNKDKPLDIKEIICLFLSDALSQTETGFEIFSQSGLRPYNTYTQ